MTAEFKPGDRVRVSGSPEVIWEIVTIEDGHAWLLARVGAHRRSGARHWATSDGRVPLSQLERAPIVDMLGDIL